MILQTKLGKLQNSKEDLNKEIQSMISSIHQVTILQIV